MGLLLVLPPLGTGLANLSYDSIFWLRDDVPAAEAVIVYMDDESHSRLKQPSLERWDRSLHALLIERLSALGARVIAFDILFSGESEPRADARLVSAARSHGKVVVAAKMEEVLSHGELYGWEPHLAFPALAEVTSSGVAEQADPDGSIRRHYFNANQTNLPSLAWRAASLAGMSPPAPAGERWVNYYGPPGFLDHVSYFEVFETNSSLASMVSNRVVFVGALYSVGFTGGKGTDDFRTPYVSSTGRRSPGVEINATNFLNLARGDWLRRLPAVAEAGLILVAGLWLGFAFSRLRPLAAVGAGLLAALVVAGVATASAWTVRVWFPWSVVVVGQLPVALACSVIGQSRRLIKEKKAFEQALALASEGRGTTTAVSATGGVHPDADGGTAGRGEPVLPAFLREPEPKDLGELPRVPDHELIRCIGRGGFGEVWLARDIFGSHHAVKLLRLRAFTSASPMQTEFDGLRKFTPVSRSHPGLVHILHVGRDESKACLYCVMELADDESAGQRIDPETYVPRTLAGEVARRGRLPLAEVLEMAIRLADAVEHLHRHHLVHRDIKPANIVFVKGEAKLADAGLVADAVAGNGEAGHVGTPGRIAPEGAGSPASDVYSLGTVLYEAGLGMAIERFPELPRSMIDSGTDRDLFELNRVIMRACEADARRRISTAAELRDLLAPLRARVLARQAASPSGD